MQDIFTYNAKDYRSRYHGVGLITKLIQAGVNYKEDKTNPRAIKIQVAEEELEKALEVRKTYNQKVEANKKAFVKAIKVKHSTHSFDPTSLYKRIKNIFPGQVYLPESWKNGGSHSIQNYSQSDFWSFSFANISGCKEEKNNGSRVIVKTLSGRMVWILDSKFQSSIAAYMEDSKIGAFEEPIQTFDDLLNKMALVKMTGEQWKSHRENKTIIEY